MKYYHCIKVILSILETRISVQNMTSFPDFVMILEIYHFAGSGN